MSKSTKNIGPYVVHPGMRLKDFLLILQNLQFDVWYSRGDLLITLPGTGESYRVRARLSKDVGRALIAWTRRVLRKQRKDEMMRKEENPRPETKKTQLIRALLLLNKKEVCVDEVLANAPGLSKKAATDGLSHARRERLVYSLGGGRWTVYLPSIQADYPELIPGQKTEHKSDAANTISPFSSLSPRNDTSEPPVAQLDGKDEGNIYGNPQTKAAPPASVDDLIQKEIEYHYEAIARLEQMRASLEEREQNLRDIKASSDMMIEMLNKLK